MRSATRSSARSRPGRTRTARPGGLARIETPKGHYLDREAQVDQLFDLERWVAFCKLTGGKLALTAPTSNAVLVRYRPDDDLEEKKAEAVEPKRNSSILQLVGLLKAAGMREADFAEIRLKPSYGASGPYEVEVVEPCVQTPQRKTMP